MEQLQFICHQTVGRYELLLLNAQQQPIASLYSKAYLNHMQFWPFMRAVVVHSTSKKLLLNPELYGSFSLALTCATNQTPRVVKSTQSIAGFKMMKNSVLGALSHLRSRRSYSFCYKWAFLAANVSNLKGSSLSTAVGVNNIFVFELDQLDYSSFEPLPGLEISFDKNVN